MVKKTTTEKKPAKKKRKPNPKRNGKATSKKPEAFKLNAALSRLSAFCGDINFRCVVSNEDTPFFAAAFVGNKYIVGKGKSAGGALKGLWDAVAEVVDIDG